MRVRLKKYPSFIQMPLVFAIFLSFNIGSQASPLNYDYPFDNPYVATIVGTPEQYQDKFTYSSDIVTRQLKKVVGPPIPDIFSYHEELSYSLGLQDNPAPLIFIVAGTGGDHKADKNMLLMQAFYRAGFHVVGLTSPSHQHFIITSSKSGVPGGLHQDSADLYAVMQRIVQALKGEIEISEFFLTGYSLGGAHAAFISSIDSAEQAFSFKKVLLLNPPLSLYSSISKLDRMLENVPGGVDHFNQFFRKIVERISRVYRRSNSVEFNESLVFEAFKQELPRDEQLAAIIGVAFRFSAANMAFTADAMTNYGYVKSKSIDLKSHDSLQQYLRLSMRLGFTDYFHEFFYPYYEKKYPDITREVLVKNQTLLAIKAHLKSTKHVGLVHNSDDVILIEGDIEEFENIFGMRAKIFPRGGHLGNLKHRDTLSYIINFFVKGE